MDINYLKNSTNSYDGGEKNEKKPLKFKDKIIEDIIPNKSQSKVYSDEYIKSLLLREESREEIMNDTFRPLERKKTTGELINCEAIISIEDAKYLIKQINNIIMADRRHIRAFKSRSISEIKKYRGYMKDEIHRIIMFSKRREHRVLGDLRKSLVHNVERVIEVIDYVLNTGVINNLKNNKFFNIDTGKNIEYIETYQKKMKELEKQKKEEIEPLKQKQVKKEKEILEKLSKNVIEAMNNYNKDKRVEFSFTGNGIKKILIYKTGSWISKGKYVEGLITGINAGDDKSVKIKIGEESFDLDFDEICIDTGNFRIPK